MEIDRSTPIQCTKHLSSRTRLDLKFSSLIAVATLFLANEIAMLPMAAAVAASPAVDEDGSVFFPHVKVPFSDLATPEAKKRWIEDAKPSSSVPARPNADDIVHYRQWVDDTSAKPWVRQWRAKFPVTITPATIGGVQTDVIEPEGGVSGNNKKRVLINLHGGGLIVGARFHGQAESIPIASIGKIKVITVDYRLAPEHRFPAASEDVAAVYRALLREYRPKNIGIYGCSAGGYLTAASVAWFQTHGLPRPGAAGIFSSGGVGDNRVGDSYYSAFALQGVGVDANDKPKIGAYFSSADLADPLVSPADFLDVLRVFPPSLLISGTRDASLSQAIYTDTQLIKAGAKSELHVWDGMGHCFVIDEDVPETHDAWNVIVRFFDQHLGTR